MNGKINQTELDNRLINTKHLCHESIEKLNNAFVVVYANTDTIFIYDGNGLSEKEKIELIEFLILQVQSGTNFKREIISQSNNIYFVY